MKIEKIKDFIKSFFYYPKMKRYFKESKTEQYDIWKSAIKYAWWHCKVGKLKPNNSLILDDLVEQLNNLLEKDEWKPIYGQKPIVREYE